MDNPALHAVSIVKDLTSSQRAGARSLQDSWEEREILAQHLVGQQINTEGEVIWVREGASSDSINSITISPNNYKMPGGKRMVDLDDLS